VFFRRRRRDEDFAAEIEAHLQLEADRLRESGLSPADAEAAARRAFGNVTSARERFHEAGRWLFWDRLRQDLRFTGRLLARSPVLTATVTLTLALGIGANSLVFSLVRAVVFRPLPYPEPDRLVQLWETGLRSAGDADWLSLPNFRDWQTAGGVFDGMAAYRYAPLTLTGEPQAESVLGLEATDRLFALLGVEPALGRTFRTGEDAPGRDRVAVISHALWERRFAREAGVVGRAMNVEGQPYTIVGVMPPAFRFPNKLPAEVGVIPIDVWIPLRPAPDLEDRDSHNFWAVARLAPGVGLAEARLRMRTIGESLARQYPGSNAGMSVAVERLHDYVSGSARPALLSLLGAVSLVLLLACANVANLLLSRAESRRREIAIRQALGAGRGRLIRQNLTESLVLALLGAAAGLVLAAGGIRLVTRFGPANIPRLAEASIDAPAVLFTAGVAMAVGLLFGIAPALFGARSNLRGALQRAGLRASSGPASLRLRHALVGVQMALAVMLLVGAGLLIRSFVRVAGLDPGFHAPRVLIAVVMLPPARYGDPPRQRAFFESVLQGIRALPGVESAAASNSVPLTGINDQGSVRIEGAQEPAAGEDGPLANRPRVSTDYFETMGIPLLEGRLFHERDRAESPAVAVVSDRAARAFWPGGSPLGKRVGVWANGRWVWREVVGVVRGTRHFGLEAPGTPEVYVPSAQEPYPFMTLVVRGRGDVASLKSAINDRIAAVDPEQAALAFQGMDELLSTAGARRRFVTSLATAFAALAMLLAALGVYGVMVYTVSTRTREIGVRVALGGRPADVVASVLGSAMRVSVLGMAAGVAGAAALSRLLAGLLFGVSALDPAAFAAAPLLLLAASAAAAFVPGRGAARLNPVVALRED
jgi:putative ABC transport system permease protein